VRIAIDLDGVTYEFERTARYMLRELRGYADVKELQTESTEWDYIPNHIGSDDWRWLWDEGIELGLFRYGHVSTGAIVGLRALLKAKHDLLVVTHRPRKAVPDTLAWLSYINIPFSEVHILSDGQRKSSVAADLIIDDKWENVREWAQRDRHAILFDRPWNQDHYDTDQITRAFGWGKVVDAVQDVGLRLTQGVSKRDAAGYR